MAQSAAKNPRRRWLQFSLRSLLVALTLFGILLGGWVNRATRQREAVAAIRAAHGEVGYDYQRTQYSYSIEQAGAPDRLSNWLGIDYFHSVVVIALGGSLTPAATFNDDVRAKIGDLSRTEILRLGPGVTDSNLASIEGLRNVRYLTIQSPQLTDAGLIHLASLKRLLQVEIFDSRITGSGLKFLQSTDVQHLDLRKTQSQRLDLSALLMLRHLRGAYLDSTNLDDESLEPLRGCRRLQLLTLGRTRVTDAGLEVVGGLPELQVIDLSHTHVTDSGLARLNQLAKLESLYLAVTAVNGEGFKHLRGLARLQRLDLRGSKLNDAGLGQVARLRGLKAIELDDTEITDAGVAHLQKRDSLEWIGGLSRTQVTKEGRRALKQALPKCDFR